MAETEAAFSEFEEHRLSEFIYGTTTGLVAISGMTGSYNGNWWEAAVTIVVGACAVWIAHSYAGAMSKRVRLGRPLEGKDLLVAIRGSQPIAAAGLIVAAPQLLAAFGVTTAVVALDIGSAVGILTLGIVGVLAGRLARASVGRTIALAALSAGLGVLVVSIDLLVHH